MTQTVLQAPLSEVRHDLAGLAGNYVQFCAEHLGQLGESIVKQDVDSVSGIAHTLAGNAGRLGLSELSSLGRQLEEYCAGPDWSAISSAYRAIAETVLGLCETEPVSVRVFVEPGAPPVDVSVKQVQ